MEDHISHKVGRRIFAGALFAIAFINAVNAVGCAFADE